ncbi:hypothetical protein AZI86_13460 [Bdellovibrio bacteriovorus]|uniref:Lipoprotein n=1 Tax=Bdellovibrio bacteriovorus TaxID=959 RepID=A0A150WJM1_BDEBC|nr:hypothetical protein [Bdellovibrio bacteriovorus]KYG63823.1 hypothetical protein AZI86_13460 [Bdellovibrio bacteriovorus]
MKVLVSGLFVSLAVLGCTHSNVQPSTPPPQGDVHYLKPGERQPAQSYELLWHPAKFAMDVTRESEAQAFKGQISQEMVWKQVVTDYTSTWEERDVEVPGMCSRVNCPPATGDSALWQAYFSATTKEKKADALAKAIEGIGEVSSKALVEKGYFRTKPRSWTEFEAEINRAAQAGVIRKNVATMVTDNYQLENVNKLGYKKEACTMIKSPCTKVISQRVEKRTPKNRTVETRQIVQSIPVELRVNVLDAKLLPWERDQLSIAVDNDMRASLDVNGYNRYQIVKQEVGTVGATRVLNLNLQADSRELRDLPGNVILSDRYELIGGKATFTVELDPKYFNEIKNDPNAQFEIEYNVNTCEYGWSGTCGFSSWKKISSTVAVLNQPKMTVVLDVPAKHKSYVGYRIARRNSEFFNAKPTYERSSDSVKMPKF